MIVQKYDQIGTKIVVCGIGRSGTRAIEGTPKNIPCVQYYSVYTDKQAFSMSPSKSKVLLDGDFSDKGGCGKDFDMGRAAAQRNVNYLSSMIEQADIVFIVAGLGGGTGSAIAPFMAELALKNNVFALSVFTAPTDAEDIQAAQNAKRALNEYRAMTMPYILMPYDSAAQRSGKTDGYRSFDYSDSMIRDCIVSFTNFLSFPLLIGFDMEDLKAIFKNASESFFACAKSDMSEGEEGMRQAIANACKGLMANADMKNAKRAVVMVHGGTGLKLNHINNAVEGFKDILSPACFALFGCGIEENLKTVSFAIVVTAFPPHQADSVDCS